MATIREWHLSFIEGVALSQGLICILHLGLRKVAFIEGVSSRQAWPLRGVPLYSAFTTNNSFMTSDTINDSPSVGHPLNLASK